MKPRIDARGLNGNTLAVLSACTQALEKAGKRDQARELRGKALTGDRDFALATMMQYVEFTFGDVPEFDDDDATLPAGKYVVADPCYILSNDVYNAMLEAGAFDEEKPFVFGTDVFGNEKRLVILHTTHGDGAYTSDDGHEQLVDSGTIACIEVAPEFFHATWERYPQYEADEAFQCKRDDDGVLHFGTLTSIETDGHKCDECGDRYCESCDRCGGCPQYCTCDDDDDSDDDE